MRLDAKRELIRDRSAYSIPRLIADLVCGTQAVLAIVMGFLVWRNYSVLLPISGDGVFMVTIGIMVISTVGGAYLLREFLQSWFDVADCNLDGLKLEWEREKESPFSK